MNKYSTSSTCHIRPPSSVKSHSSKVSLCDADTSPNIHYVLDAAAGVEGIVLLFSANDGSGPVYKFPAYDYFAPVLEPLLEEVCAPCCLPANTCNVLVACNKHQEKHLSAAQHCQPALCSSLCG